MFIERVIKTQDQLTQTVRNVAPQPSRFAAVTLPALLRFALLLGPTTLSIYLLHDRPIFCLLICLAVLTVWLTVDAGPFRAVNVSRSERTAALPPFTGKRLAWNELLGRMFLMFLVLYSRLNL